MVSALISRIVILGLGTLYPAYASYKAVKTKNVKEYVKWMMYWIVFALFTCAETFADIFIAFWVPFYYELKILFVLWLLSPATKGASILYRKFVHPQFSKHEQEIDEALARAKEQGYSAILHLGSRGLTYASNVVMQTALMGQATLVSHLRKSYSMSDLGLQQQFGAAYQDNQHGFDFGPEGPQNMLVTHKWQSEGVLIEEIEETPEEVSERPTRSRSRGHQTSSDSGEGSSSGSLTRTRSVPKSSSKGSQHSSGGGGKSATHTEVTAYATLPRTGKGKGTKRKQQHSKQS